MAVRAKNVQSGIFNAHEKALPQNQLPLELQL